MNKVCFCAAAVLVSVTVGAREYLWNGQGQSSDWTDLKNWQIRDSTETVTRLPGAGDSVWVGIHYPLRLDASDAASLAVLNAVDIVHLAESTSEGYITVPEETDASIEVPIVGGYEAGGRSDKGCLYISGPGTLRLKSKNLTGYYTKILQVDGTSLWTTQAPDLALTQYNLGHVTVTNGATLYLPTCHNGALNMGNNYVNVQRLFGDGTVTSVENTEIRFAGSGGVFAGVLGEKIRIFSGGRQYLVGTNSTMKWANPIVYNVKTAWTTGAGVLGVMKFGKQGEATSSLGALGNFTANVYGGAYLYLGKGEKTDKLFQPYGQASGYNIIDGGPYGGLEFVTKADPQFTANGGMRANGSGNAYNTIIGLGGTNSLAPCVMRGQYNENDSAYLVTTIKKGPGTWRFTDPEADGNLVKDFRSFRGSISVDEGVFQFDTIAPQGEFSSVGLASVLKGPALGLWAELPDVDWAFSLGGTNSALKGLAEGTLEYTGTNATMCLDRRIRLEADGRLRANGPAPSRYRLAGSTSARAKTLSLDGSSVATNEVHDIVDTATHPVSVVKEGSGTWLVGGDKAFHGDLTVKGGKLIVREWEAARPYTWFRYTVKNLFDSVTGSGKAPVSVRFLGLYDADGNCQSLNVRQPTDMTAAAVLQPGEAGYETRRGHAKGSYSSNGHHNDNVTNLFGTAYVFDVNMKSPSGASSYFPQFGTPDSYLPIIVHLREDANTIASYDWSTTYGYTSGNKGGFHWMPNRWSLEGSVDGIHWENVNPDGGDYAITTNDYPAVAFDSRFVKINQAWSNGLAAKHTGGWEIRGTSTNALAVLANVRTVQVDAGATLEIENAQSEISKLCVDAQLGAGTIRGAAFAANGSIRIKGYSREKLSIPFDLSGSTDVENLADWSVTVDGKTSAGYRVCYAAGKLSVYPPGALLIVR